MTTVLQTPIASAILLVVLRSVARRFLIR